MKKFLVIFGVTALTVAVVFSFGVSRTYKSSKHAWLGVVGQTVDDDLADDFRLPVDEGAYINDVLRDSPAEEAGLDEDDIVIAFDGERVRDWDDLEDMIDDHKPGDEVSLTVMRDDDKIELKATLEGRPRGRTSRNVWYSDDDMHVLRAPRAPKAPRIPSLPKIDRMVFIDDFTGPYMGVRLTSLTKQLGEYFGVEKGRGVLINEVEKDSPAEKAGLKAGDVIVSVDGDKVWDYEDVLDAVSETDEGEILAVTVMRDKSEKSFDVEVEERDSDSDRNFHWYTKDCNVNVPRIITRGYSGHHDDFDFYFDSEDFEDEMEDLAEEMEELAEELEDMELDRSYKLKSELKEELRDLKEELEELEERIY